MMINFKCKKCGREFDCDIGKIGIDNIRMRPTFKKEIVCPKCGKLTMDDVLLTQGNRMTLSENCMEYLVLSGGNTATVPEL
jgi:transcription elongation factor Elf1